jgi:hypothetical protein
MCDEPFHYAAEPVSACLSGRETPGIQVLGRRLPNSGPARMVFEYNLPAEGNALVELFNPAGDRVAIPAQGWVSNGIHMAEWAALGVPSGRYYCRLRANGFEQIKPFELLG